MAAAASPTDSANDLVWCSRRERRASIEKAFIATARDCSRGRHPNPRIVRDVQPVLADADIWRQIAKVATTARSRTVRLWAAHLMSTFTEGLISKSVTARTRQRIRLALEIRDPPLI